MASEAEASELITLFERLFSRHRDLSLFIPFILGFANAATSTTTSENPESDQEPQTGTATPQERIILINPFTQGMVVIEGGAAGALESLIRDLASKSGPPPASKASIEAMPSVVMSESEVGNGGECVICLEEWEVGGVLKEMPCKHRFHGGCIEKWLGIHGSCPVCRYKMPVDDEELTKKRDEEEGEDAEEGRDRRRRIGREIWVTFSLNVNRGGQNSDSNQTPSTESTDNSSSSPISDHEMEG